MCELSQRRYWWSLGISAVVLLGGLWVNTGSLAPYATSCRWTEFDERCGYVYNIDHGQFVATYDMLAGGERGAYEWSVVLRRILYPLVCYPFMKWLGFETGGLLVNVVVTLFVFVFFVSFLRKQFGEYAALAGMWLGATFPGIFYFSGLPYCYAMIAPLCLVMLVVLRAAWMRSDVRSLLGGAAVIGVLSTGYDFLVLFGAAYGLVLLLKRRYRLWVPAAFLLVLPSVLVGLVLKYHYKVDLLNENTQMYGNLFSGFKGDINYARWFSLIAQYPGILVDNVFASGFFFLPGLFLVVLAVNWRLRLVRLEATELILLCILLAMHALNNLVPPYGGWSLRGVGMARLYEPFAFVALLFVARYYQRLALCAPEERRRAGYVPQMGILVATVLLNASVVFGGLWDNPLTAHTCYRFYRHSPEDTWARNVSLYGKTLFKCRAPGRLHRVDLAEAESVENAKRILAKRGKSKRH